MDFADLRERRVDVMLGRAPASALGDDLRRDVLGDEQLLAVAGGQNAWAHAPAMRFADVAGRPWVLAPAGTAVYELVAAAFRAEGLAMPVPAVTTYSMTLRLQLLASGDYVTAFPDALVRNNLGRWNLAVLPLALGQPLPVSVYSLKSRGDSRLIEAFVAAAQAVTGSGA